MGVGFFRVVIVLQVIVVPWLANYMFLESSEDFKPAAMTTIVLMLVASVVAAGFGLFADRKELERAFGIRQDGDQ